jgi:hypothetical protein
MKIIRRSSLQEYARHFLENEKYKDEQKAKVFEDVQRSPDPLSWLKANEFGYKLPKEQYSEVFVVRIESLAELERFRIYDRMVSASDPWMQDQHLSPDPLKPYIGALADYFLDVDYFGTPRCNSAQYKRYHEWKPRPHLTGAISSSAMPLIRGRIDSEFKIIDGFGRLLAYAALCKEGFTFAEFECFLATDTESANKCDMAISTLKPAVQPGPASGA